MDSERYYQPSSSEVKCSSVQIMRQPACRSACRSQEGVTRHRQASRLMQLKSRRAAEQPPRNYNADQTSRETYARPAKSQAENRKKDRYSK